VKPFIALYEDQFVQVLEFVHTPEVEGRISAVTVQENGQLAAIGLMLLKVYNPNAEMANGDRFVTARIEP
jgi:hypothetical protein